MVFFHLKTKNRSVAKHQLKVSSSILTNCTLILFFELGFFDCMTLYKYFYYLKTPNWDKNICSTDMWNETIFVTFQFVCESRSKGN